MAAIEAEGSLSFVKYLELVLYHPELGYYARTDRQRTGRDGDFFTAVSVGPLFGRILAEYGLQLWETLGRPEAFRITEWGAEQGDLAGDILAGAAAIGGDFAAAMSYAIVEPIEMKRAFLEETVPQANVVAEANELPPLPGFIVANELLDAFPFWRVTWRGGKWRECRVACGEKGGLTTIEEEPRGDLAARRSLIAPFEKRLPEGYTTELRPAMTGFLRQIARTLQSGELLFFDYGYERRDYYDPARTTGTVRTYRAHKAGEELLTNLGSTDITAHVEFDALHEEGEAAGLRAHALQQQGSFLTRAAINLLRAQDGTEDAKFFRAFQTLTHPAQLGAKFWVKRFSI